MAEDYDIIEVEQLPDGRYKYTTDPISPENHASAESFFRVLSRISGGDMAKAPRHAKLHKHQHKTKVPLKQK